MLPNKSRTTIPENGPKRNPHVVPEPSPQTPQVSVNYLSRILDRKLEEIARLRKRSGELEASAAAAPSARSWVSALRRPGEVALIAELKRRAPSAGELRPEMDPASLARSYESAGAAALSVLTDLDFAGQLSDMEEARSAVSLPTLRKDFILDPLQVLESRAAGADAVLLIVAALSNDQLAELLSATSGLGMGSLVEVHDEHELERALAVDAVVIGINNRDLTTFETRREVSHRLAPSVPGDRVLVAESGIESAEQVSELGDAGVDAVLVGTALVTEAEPEELARALASQTKRARL